LSESLPESGGRAWEGCRTCRGRKNWIIWKFFGPFSANFVSSLAHSDELGKAQYIVPWAQKLDYLEIFWTIFGQFCDFFGTFGNPLGDP
jgi:hypothetical protein